MYTYSAPARANVWVFDSGIRASHNEFSALGPKVFGGVDFRYGPFRPWYIGPDCNGHGTAVTALVNGTNYGVAKDAHVYGVGVLFCDLTTHASTVVSALNYVNQNRNTADKVVNEDWPDIANLSLSFPNGSQTVDDATVALINSGVTVVTSSGNDFSNLCQASPARVAAAITVGGSTTADAVPAESNGGSCVDIHAPAYGITSADSASNIDFRSNWSGTSFAAPHVSGVVAQYLTANFGATPQQARDALVANSTQSVLTGVKANTPNRLLFSRFFSY